MVTIYFTFFNEKYDSTRRKKKMKKSHYPFQVYGLVASLPYVLEVPQMSLVAYVMVVAYLPYLVVVPQIVLVACVLVVACVGGASLPYLLEVPQMGFVACVQGMASLPWEPHRIGLVACVSWLVITIFPSSFELDYNPCNAQLFFIVFL